MYKDIKIKTDGTFIVDFNGMPFHVTPDYPSAELYGDEMTFPAVEKYAAANPEKVSEYEEPVSEVSEEQARQAEISGLEKEAQSLMPAIYCGIDADYNRDRLKKIMLRIKELKENI